MGLATSTGIFQGPLHRGVRACSCLQCAYSVPTVCLQCPNAAARGLANIFVFWCPDAACEGFSKFEVWRAGFEHRTVCGLRMQLRRERERKRQKERDKNLRERERERKSEILMLSEVDSPFEAQMYVVMRSCHAPALTISLVLSLSLSLPPSLPPSFPSSLPPSLLHPSLSLSLPLSFLPFLFFFPRCRSSSASHLTQGTILKSQRHSILTI
jgi:hypothetical protein